MLSGATAVAAAAAPYAARADAERRLSGEVMSEIVRAGFARHFVPSRWGGREAGFGEWVRAVAVVGEGCTSAAWCASLAAATGRLVAYLPVEGQREVWRDGPDTLVVGGLVPWGTAESGPGGGWTLSGSWPYVSGVDFAEWALVCAWATGRGARHARFFVLPRRSFSVVDSWDNLGMRATGSHTLVADGVRVPDHLTVTRDCPAAGSADATGSAAGSVAGSGDGSGSGSGGGSGSLAVCHQTPLRAVNGLAFAAPVLGAVQAMIRVSTEAVEARAARGGNTPGVPVSVPVATQLALARAAGEVDAAELLLQRVAATADRGNLGAVEVGRGARDCALAAEILTTASERLFELTGTSGHAQSHPIQRIWRDVRSATSHLALRFDTAAVGPP